jgi:hypothetical protein
VRAYNAITRKEAGIGPPPLLSYPHFYPQPMVSGGSCEDNRIFNAILRVMGRLGEDTVCRSQP